MSNHIPLFDLHCDTITRCAGLGESLYDNSGQISLTKGARYDGWCQIFAIWIPDELRGRAAQHYFEDNARFFAEQTKQYADSISFCTTPAHLQEAQAADRCAALLSIEGGAALGGELERLTEYYDQGVRLMTLTWNDANELATGCFGGDSGLTPFGRRVVEEMGRLGMVTDVSHLNERGFYEVAELQAGPFVATHSNFSDVWRHPRNLTGEQFEIIRQTGGLVGLNLYWAFLGDSQTSGLDAAYRHLSYGLEAGGEKTLALGCDFDGADMPEDLNGIDRLEGLWDYLLSRGLEERLLRDVFYQNAATYFERMLRPSKG